MKIEIDLDTAGLNIYRFESKEEYEKCVHSYASYFARIKAKGYNSYDRFDCEPSRFPCIGLEICTNYRSDGPDEMCMLWLYPGVNCKVIEE